REIPVPVPADAPQIRQTPRKLLGRSAGLMRLTYKRSAHIHDKQASEALCARTWLSEAINREREEDNLRISWSIVILWRKSLATSECVAEQAPLTSDALDDAAPKHLRAAGSSFARLTNSGSACATSSAAG